VLTSGGLQVSRMAKERTGTHHTLSASYASHLLELVRRWGVEDEELLEGFDLRSEKLTDPSLSLPLDVAVALLNRATALTGEAALGVYLGLQMRSSSHGILGFAAMSAPTLRDAVVVSTQYMAIRTTAVSLRSHVAGGVGSLVLLEHADLGQAREGYVFAILVGFWRMGSILLGRNLDVTLDLGFPRPAYYDRFADALPPARFDQPAHQLVLRDLALLGTPLQMADAASMRLARDHCARLLESMGLDGRLAPRVRSLLARKEGQLQSLKGVAAALRLSARTLRRHLEQEGVTFSELIDEERKRRGLLLLRSRELSIQQIADSLGYSDVANFTRAFRRWTGKTPTAYRSDR